MDIYWGDKNNKRKFDDIDSDSDEPTMEPDRKKLKLFKSDKMIYTIDNEVHFTESVNSRTIETLIKKITKLINKNNDKYVGGKEKYNINLIIDSGGGGIFALCKFVDFLALTKKKYPYVTFTSIVTGWAASAGTVMAIACDRRLMTRNATYMIHELKYLESSIIV
jgi:ATP-dependent protease ClpP protease subunit